MRTRWGDFVQGVRRFRPSSLLAASAAISIDNFQKRVSDEPAGPTGTDDFALAAMCKAALLHGNEYRDKIPTKEDIRKLCALLIDVYDPFVDDQKVGSFLVRIAHEQILYQEPLSQSLGRVRAMLQDAAASAHQQVITPSFWQDLLGCTLDELVGVALLLHTSALHNRGSFDFAWLDGPQFDPVYRVIPRSVIEHIAREHFIATPAQFRALARPGELPDANLKRYEFNPLLRVPFVAIDGYRPIAPVLSRVCFRATPGSLYYTAIERFKGQFSDALGIVFERYVGMQLRLCNPIGVSDERKYGNSKSVDFIAVFERAVLLVEAKATPLTLLARAGQDKLSEDIRRAPGKAQGQIENTAALIRDRHTAFSDIPADRPMVGLIVTMEPYYACDIATVFSESGRTIPICLSSARELEDLMSLSTGQVDAILASVASDSARRSWTISEVMQGTPIGHNAILESAWRSYPFTSIGQGS